MQKRVLNGADTVVLTAVPKAGAGYEGVRLLYQAGQEGTNNFYQTQMSVLNSAASIEVAAELLDLTPLSPDEINSAMAERIIAACDRIKESLLNPPPPEEVETQSSSSAVETVAAPEKDDADDAIPTAPSPQSPVPTNDGPEGFESY